MSSVSKKAAAKAEKAARLAELQVKIQDPLYIDGAIQRIALVLSNNLVADNKQTQGRLINANR